jgi:hypothetical protein
MLKIFASYQGKYHQTNHYQSFFQDGIYCRLSAPLRQYKRRKNDNKKRLYTKLRILMAATRQHLMPLLVDFFATW